jgi:hypothetical protein
MRFFKRKGEAIKKWRSRAMLISLNKTKIIFARTKDWGVPLTFKEIETDD